MSRVRMRCNLHCRTKKPCATHQRRRTVCSLCRRLSSDKSELRISGGAGERNDVANVSNTRQKHQQSFESQSKARVRNGSVAPQVHIPPIILRLQFMKFHVLEQLIEALFA